MSNDMRDWLGFAMSAASVLIPLLGWAVARRRLRRTERFRSFRAWGVEWAAYDRYDDSQS
jgi:hypothetical protein